MTYPRHLIWMEPYNMLPFVTGFFYWAQYFQRQSTFSTSLFSWLNNTPLYEYTPHHQSIEKEISPKYSLEGLMLKLKLQYFGRLMQRADSFEKTLMLGKIEGRRRRGKQRMRWLGVITDLMDMDFGGLRVLVMDSEAWRAVVHGVTKSRICLSDWTELNFLLFTAICKASSDNYLFFLYFLFLGIVLIPASCTMSQTLSIALQALCLSDVIPWIYLSVLLYNRKGFDLGHTWMV